MKVILGTYRGPEMVARGLRSLVKNLKGEWHELTIVDDSGREEWVKAYRDMRMRGVDLKVIALNQGGYNEAMQAVCAEAGDKEFFFWEEDFILKREIYIEDLQAALYSEPKLAQVALLRGPHFPIEHKHGGLLEALEAKGERIEYRFDGLIIQKATFTGNPSLWAAGVAAHGWPAGKWSEDRMRDRLLKMGYKFAFLPGIAVEHDGVRGGYAY